MIEKLTLFLSNKYIVSGYEKETFSKAAVKGADLGTVTDVEGDCNDGVKNSFETDGKQSVQQQSVQQ
jgi:hypothetical protein